MFGLCSLLHFRFICINLYKTLKTILLQHFIFFIFQLSPTKNKVFSFVSTLTFFYLYKNKTKTL